MISHLNDLSLARRAGRSSRVVISPCGLPEGRRREGWGGRRAVSGIASLDMPLPVHEMTPAKNRIGAGSRAGLSGAITCTAPAPGRGRSTKRGRGGGERRAVHGEMPAEDKIGAGTPDTPFQRLSPALPPLPYLWSGGECMIAWIE